MTISKLQAIVNSESRYIWYPGALRAELKLVGTIVTEDTVIKNMRQLCLLGTARAEKDANGHVIAYSGMVKQFYNVSSWDLFKGWVRSIEYKTFFTLSFYLVTGSALAVRGYIDLLTP